MNDCNKVKNGPILYELLEYFVRKQDPELVKWKNDAAILPTTGTIKNALRYLNNRYSLPESISQQVSLTLPWKFAVGDCGRLLALLQENVIEIRKAKDEYSSIVGKASVPKDAFPQWRKLSWSPDGTILVLASSNGYTSFYNALGNNIFNINPKTVSQNPQILEAGDAIASMIFLKPRVKNEKWSHEFILITYSGLMKSYYISLTNGFTLNFEFSFGHFYKNGVNSVVYDTKHNLFYVAGNTITQKITSTASESGLTSWRPLNDYPYCKLSFTFDQQAKPQLRFSIWNIIPSMNSRTESIIFKTSISPSSRFLTCSHTDGSISLWSLPNLMFLQKWKLPEQPDFNISNPLSIVKAKKFSAGLMEFQPVDIGWWSDQAIIIARYTGSTSVCSTKNLKNLLGASPEFLAGQPQICELGTDRGFLCLDCESFITSKKRNHGSSTEAQLSEASSDSEREDDELEPITIFNYTTNLVQSTLYSITDIEKFQPKRKKSKVLYRTYRILGLKSTTPEELYSRKIDIEEYDEALALANTYNLDTDLVYQTQWRKSELSLNAIQEHLSKVTKRSWVLNECVTRVPDTLEAARELLHFGLKGANLETLLAIGICDNGKFVIDTSDEDWDDVDESSVSLRQVQKVNQILCKIDIKNMSDAQKDLIRYRRKLLNHLDKLLTYEILLEPALKYSKVFYEEFRELSAIENAVRFAKESNHRGVEIMFTYYGESLLPHWLAIISFFPETLNPLNYENLLPHCDSDGQLFLPDQRELRQKDWSEKVEFNEIVSLENDDKSQLLYDYDPTLCAYRTMQLNTELLRTWFKSRAYQIEQNSFMVVNALQLVKIAQSHNIPGLDELLLDLETLDDIVYKVYVEDMSLDELEKLDSLEKIKLLMSKSSEKTFVDDIKHLVLPFIKRRHQYLGGDAPNYLLWDYLTCISKDDITLPAKLFEHLRQSQDADLHRVIGDSAALALDCIYTCNDFNMHDKAKHILDSISKDRSGKRSGTTCTLLEELERELECANILNKYGVNTTLNFLQKNKSNPEAAKILLIQMARNLNKISPPPDERQWAQLLNDMLEIHGLIFTCVDIEICFEICVSARLVSGSKSNIQNCVALIETRKSEQSLLKVSYEKAVNLILDASKEYFNSSKSLTDTNMELAKACLHLIADDNAQIKQEYELINSLQILNEFNVDILPLQVRLTQDKLKLVKSCLEKRDNAHKSRQRLLTLANYLRIEERSSNMREGKVLELIAQRALEVEDYAVCASTCLQLMQNNYVPAWSVALNLGYSEKYDDLEVRQKCIWFAMNNGPSDILGTALERLHLIEIQMLHKNLQLWIPVNGNDEINDEADSEDEFIDAMTTPQIETKEFVPRILETSTEIVKNSASIVKESTFDLIKNISDSGFWKQRLKFNLSGSFGNEPHAENIESDTEPADIQSFPTFYESLHKEYRLSNLDTKYTLYSMPEIQNTKLKCCRAFLRITMLSESSCYGAEVSDVRHLFLECAKYTISEDWLLGMAYLYSLGKDRILDADTTLSDLPPTDLYAQTAAYYYSLELYKKLNPNIEELHLYDPLHLIRKMMRTIPAAKEYEVHKALQRWQVRLSGDKKSRNKNLGSALMKADKENYVEMKCRSTVCPRQNAHLDITNAERKVEQFIEDNDGVSSNSRILDDANDSSKMKEDDNMAWTDDWGDFSDEDTEDVSSQKQSPREGFFRLEEAGSLLKNVCEQKTEEDRFEIFEGICNNIQSIEHYKEIKQILLQWPIFTDSEYITIKRHPILRTMKIIHLFVTKANTRNYETDIFQEYIDLIGKISPTDVLKEFLRDKEEYLPLEHSLYIRLYIEDALLHKEAVDIIKQKYKNLALTSPILEKLFLRNLTACFGPEHDVYNQIIEHVFVNRPLTDIEENVTLLIRELMTQKHIDHALYIVKLANAIPPSLSTFNNCFELLMRK
ncbi:hypothetical protein KM043_003931 [Ampulex compressa]|nr:hypothetical protein KM043_003931 [Ampulex compressa]